MGAKAYRGRRLYEEPVTLFRGPAIPMTHAGGGAMRQETHDAYNWNRTATLTYFDLLAFMEHMMHVQA